MPNTTMRLKKCSYCSKDIPLTIAVCPYCRRNEKGEEIDLQTGVVDPGQSVSESELHDLRSEDPVLRINVSERLAQKGPAVVPFLIEFVNDHSHKGIPDAVRILGKIRDRRAVSALTQAVHVGDEDTRIAAVWALSQINDPETLNELLRECDRNNPSVQAYLAHILSGYQDARILPMLIKLAGHSSREVAFQATWGLGETGNAGAIYPLRRQLGRKDTLIKAAAQMALRRLGGPVRRVIPLWGSILGGVVGVALAVLGWFFLIR